MCVNIKDLRVGNLVRIIKTKEIISIESIYNHLVNKLSGIAKGELKTLELSEVEAINIQEDKHLSDLGFTLRKDDSGDDVYVNKELICLKFIDNTFCLWNCRTHLDYHENIFNTELHLLQNQYYFLPGNELDVSKIK